MLPNAPQLCLDAETGALHIQAAAGQGMQTLALCVSEELSATLGAPALKQLIGQWQEQGRRFGVEVAVWVDVSASRGLLLACMEERLPYLRYRPAVEDAALPELKGRAVALGLVME